MSDFNNPNSYDKYGNPVPGEARPFSYEPVAGSGRAPYVLLGILILIGIVGGGLYFNGHHGNNANVAAAPPAMDQPAPRAMPGASPAAPSGAPIGTMNTTPAPSTPAPAGAPSQQ